MSQMQMNLPPPTMSALSNPSQRGAVEYDLVMKQEPKQARMCGVGGKADRRPIDPPPIVQLIVRPVEQQHPPAENDPNMGFLQNPYYFMFASLAKPDDDTELHWLKDGRTRCTQGSVVSSLYHLKDKLNADVGYFVFPDVSVRTEGSYRLKLSLFEVAGTLVQHCKSIYSKPFYVYTAKKFPGMEQSTELSCSLADQGIKIRIRKDIRVRDRGSDRKRARVDNDSSRSTPLASSSALQSSPPTYLPAPVSQIGIPLPSGAQTSGGQIPPPPGAQSVGSRPAGQGIPPPPGAEGVPPASGVQMIPPPPGAQIIPPPPGAQIMSGGSSNGPPMQTSTSHSSGQMMSPSPGSQATSPIEGPPQGVPIAAPQASAPATFAPSPGPPPPPAHVHGHPQDYYHHPPYDGHYYPPVWHPGYSAYHPAHEGYHPPGPMYPPPPPHGYYYPPHPPSWGTSPGWVGPDYPSRAPADYPPPRAPSEYPPPRSVAAAEFGSRAGPSNDYGPRSDYGPPRPDYSQGREYSQQREYSQMAHAGRPGDYASRAEYRDMSRDYAPQREYGPPSGPRNDDVSFSGRDGYSRDYPPVREYPPRGEGYLPPRTYTPPPTSRSAREYVQPISSRRQSSGEYARQGGYATSSFTASPPASYTTAGTPYAASTPGATYAPGPPPYPSPSPVPQGNKLSIGSILSKERD
ncbi:hypothetical protein CYLTODRAFT_366949 [Cylindrobasidium torrendii FP15055 ss-10]|uniref:Velvet domain-containing protein n=1 Tax=Cylindrobasidium torrendii FP15055 ss-10 TaxID=1314674 RepID=A0A0D7BRK4_9AGAR|nr:hypothetical protein CYLTODRAFT_366949 [Cylindrobasidium torrendii FP15055 ss-10]